MKLLYVTYFILCVNSAIDTGRHQDIPIDEVEEHIKEGDLIPYLSDRLGDDIDLGLLPPEDAQVLNERLNDLLITHGGRERRKWGVENSGLCLLVAWANEIMQHEAGQQDMGS